MSVEPGRSQSHIDALSDTGDWLPFDTAGAGAVAARPRREAKSGQLIAGRYLLQHVLGRGGMGNVWLAEDAILVRPVAIKEFTLSEETLDEGEARTRVLGEAQAAARVRHPGIVGVYDLAIEDGRLWIVMEALSGQTLAQAIRQRGRMDRAQVMDIAGQLLEALQAMHSAGIVHRDVKPGNVQMSSGGRVVLIDFGLASGSGPAPPIKPGQVVGSPPYMAPESIRDGSFGPASDLFSLGATLYAAVEGRQPFGDLSIFSILEAVKNEPPPPARHAGYLRPLIDGLLNKDPQARLSSLEALHCIKAVQSQRVEPAQTVPA
ncbi:MAG: serine/threonine protein kinase [Aeromicrobium sp.]|jgi:serine/threonine protein kinase|nr:serine/threonine protein kinase [Aeromicrobium sp.]MDT4912973.1 eukaryotic-like serine/threonine-protein kinase [Pseudonocardiales bacterium]